MAIHENLSGEAAIHQSAYVQSADPGAVGAFKDWYDTTNTPAVHKVRNSANTGWLTVGDTGLLNTLAADKLTESDIADDYVVSGFLPVVPSPASPTVLSYTARQFSTVSSNGLSNRNSCDVGFMTGQSADTDGNPAVIEGIIKPSANGTVVVRCATEISGSSVTVKAGSTIEIWP